MPKRHRTIILKMKYKEAGVDIEEADKFKAYIKNLSDKVGGFGGLFELPHGYKNPILVSSTDSVGTKLKIASQLGIHNTVGEDIVNHCVNDILTTGAIPLYFLDYIGTGKLDIEIQKEVITGIATGCKKNNTILLGGETAELPGFYNTGEYELVGFITGIVEKENLIDGHNIVVGDKLIGIASNGLHTNGYSLVRKIIQEKGLKLSLYIKEFGCSLGEELLRVHRSYKDEFYPFLTQVKGIVHITGGGFYGNIPRILPKGIGVRIYKDSWEVPPVFRFIQCEGKVDEYEMFRVFNMGIGMIVIVADSSIFKEGYLIGETINGEGVEII